MKKIFDYTTLLTPPKNKQYTDGYTLMIVTIEYRIEGMRWAIVFFISRIKSILQQNNHDAPLNLHQANQYTTIFNRNAKKQCIQMNGNRVYLIAIGCSTFIDEPGARFVFQ